MTETKRELLQQAAALLSTATEKESAIRSIRAVAARMAPGATVEVHGQNLTKQHLEWVAADMEKEIAPIKQQARALQDRAMAMKG